MKEIQPVSIWYNGIMVAATIFNLIGQNDNLSTSATFTYQLYTVDNTYFPIASGQLTMSGFDYEAYSTSPDSNSYAYQWGATQLNITLI
jgi:hypothetical protein